MSCAMAASTKCFCASVSADADADGCCCWTILSMSTSSIDASTAPFTPAARTASASTEVAAEDGEDGDDAAPREGSALCCSHVISSSLLHCE